MAASGAIYSCSDRIYKPDAVDAKGPKNAAVTAFSRSNDRGFSPSPPRRSRMLGITVGAAIRSDEPSAEKRRDAGIYVVSSTTNFAARRMMSIEKQSLMLRQEMADIEMVKVN